MKPQDILDIAFKDASKAASAKTSRQKGEQKFIELDLIRLNTAYAITVGYLNAYVTKSSEELTPFAKELVSTMVDMPQKNKEAEQIKASIRILRRLKEEHEMKIKYSKNRVESDHMRSAFYGRLCSLIKRMKFDEIEKFNKVIPDVPHLKNMSTIIIAGYPNVGKSQLLKTMSGHKVKTAPYPFTTKELLVGFVKNRHEDVQVIDTPGVLDRPIEKRNEIEKRAIVAMKFLSSNVLFVIDPSETCGFTIGEQMKLRDELITEFNPKIMMVATKKDIVKDETVKVDYYVNGKDDSDVEGLRAAMMDFFYNDDAKKAKKAK